MNLNWNEYAHLFDWELQAINSHQTGDYKAWLELAKQIGGEVLELGCGSGRITAKLAQHDIDISGLDSSPVLIKMMKSKYPQLSQDKIFLGDMMTYKFPKSYDLIFYSYSTFQYLLTLEDQIQALQHIRKYLNPQGYIAFDICPYTCDLPAEQVKVLLYKKFNQALKKEVSMFTSHQVDRINQITTWHDTYVLEDNQGNRDVLHHKLSLKGIRGDFLALLLQYCGFELINSYGDFDLNEVSHSSDNIIYLAKKVD
ncbi:class I SAM-dependent methyltransferase [bacterium]|nr:class I SAM-dependent methyltransferase [bacterium]